MIHIHTKMSCKALLKETKRKNCTALEQSHITQKDNYLLVVERGTLCVYVCMCVCVHEHLRDRGFDLNSSLTQCGTTEECSNLKYACKIRDSCCGSFNIIIFVISALGFLLSF